VLFVVFLVLKLCGVIAWSWWWVFSPLLLWLAMAVLLLLAIVRKSDSEWRKFNDERKRFKRWE